SRRLYQCGQDDAAQPPHRRLARRRRPALRHARPDGAAGLALAAYHPPPRPLPRPARPAAAQLFVTLDPTARLVSSSPHTSFVLTDTVGFIRKLPHQLVAAFKATLEI